MNAKKGALAFENHYRQVFGKRYEGLYNSCFQVFYPWFLVRADMWEEIKKQWREVHLPVKETWFPYCLEWPEGVEKGRVLPGVAEGFVYPLSSSSLLPVYALSVQPDDVILDACAAPGGKTVAIAQQLDFSKGFLASHDISAERLKRLRWMLQRFGISDIELWQGVAETLYRRTDKLFTKILVDAPCSSEVHVLNSEKHIGQWSEKRIKTLHRRQVNMITALLPLLTDGGRLVYSTCALTPEENEMVVNEVLAQMGKEYALVAIDWKDLPGENGLPDYGIDPALLRRVWPDTQGLEPMFVAAFERSVSGV